MTAVTTNMSNGCDGCAVVVPVITNELAYRQTESPRVRVTQQVKRLLIHVLLFALKYHSVENLKPVEEGA